MNRRSTATAAEARAEFFEPRNLDEVKFAVAGLKDAAPQVWRCLGQEAMLAGDVEDAIWYFRRAVELDGQIPAVWQMLGRCFEEIQDEPRARDCYHLASRLLTRGSPAVGWDPEALSLLWDFPEPHEA